MKDMESIKAQFYYLYTFLFTPIDLDKIIEKVELEREFISDLGAKISTEFVIEAILEPSRFRIENDDDDDIKIHKSEEGEPWNFRSPLFMRFPHLHIVCNRINLMEKIQALKLIIADDQGKESIELNSTNFNNQSDDFYISYRIVLFETGIGAFIACINITDHGYSKLVKGSFISNSLRIACIEDSDSSHISAKLLVNNKIISLSKIFHKTISALQGALHKILTHEKYRGTISTRRCACGWIDVDEKNKLTYIQDPPEFQSYQNPYKIVILPKEKIFNEPKEQWKLLLLYPDGQPLDEDHVKTFFKTDNQGNFINLSPYKNFAVYLHLSATIGLYDPTIEDISCSESIQNYLHGLTRTIGLLRLRWHLYTASNSHFDKIIEMLHREYIEAGLLNDRIKALDKLKEKRDEIIDLKSQYLRALQDPAIYTLGSGQFNEVYNLGSKLLNIDKMQDIVWRKMEEIDNLYNMIVESIAQRAIRKSFVEKVKKDKVGSIFTISFTLSSLSLYFYYKADLLELLGEHYWDGLFVIVFLNLFIWSNWLIKDK